MGEAYRDESESLRAEVERLQRENATLTTEVSRLERLPPWRRETDRIFTAIMPVIAALCLPLGVLQAARSTGWPRALYVALAVGWGVSLLLWALAWAYARRVPR